MAGIGWTDFDRVRLAALELARRHRRVYPRGGFRGMELEPAEMQVLLALASSEARTVGQLAVELELDRTTVGHAVTRLLKAKPPLMRRRPDPDDARAQLLAPTASGRRLCERFLREIAPKLEH